MIEPLPWLPRIGIPLISAMSIASPVECSLMLPPDVYTLWPHLSEVTVGLKPLPARYSSAARTRWSIWPVRMSARPHS